MIQEAILMEYGLIILQGIVYVGLAICAIVLVHVICAWLSR